MKTMPIRYRDFRPGRKSKRWNRQRGFTLIELMVANAVLMIGVVGIIGMAVEAARQNATAMGNTEAVWAVQDRIAQLQGIQRARLQNMGQNTAFLCTGTQQFVNIGGNVVEDMSKPDGIEPLPGVVTYPFRLTLTFQGLCSPYRRAQQARQLARNAQRANTYQVTLRLDHLMKANFTRFATVYITDTP